MDVYHQRIIVLSRILSIGLAVFLINYLVAKLYTQLWNLLDQYLEEKSPVIDDFLWILLPILMAVIASWIIVFLDNRYYGIRHHSRKNFYLLSWVAFMGMILLSVFNYFQIEIILSVVVAGSAIIVFRLYRLPANFSGDTT